MSPFPQRLPEPRVTDPEGVPSLRWGVLGTGWIAERFVGSLRRNTTQRVVAVGSRTAARAAEFATRFEVPRSHGDYESLVQDTGVDVVYVATPHAAHHGDALLAVEAGKHVLVEKPLALDASLAEEVATAARARGGFCAEAMWTFYLPRWDVLRQVLESGVLGEVRTVLADHGEWFPADHRVFRPDLAGGTLLDLGVYPVALAVAVLGEPERVLASGEEHESGVNGQAAAVLSGARGAHALLHTTILSNTPTMATVAGTEGTLTLPGPFFQPGEVVLTGTDPRRRLVWSEPATGHEGLFHQAVEVARCVAEGRTESPRRPLSDSVATLRVVDEIRRQVGVTFSVP